jgi:hypothetical protein
MVLMYHRAVVFLLVNGDRAYFNRIESASKRCTVTGIPQEAAEKRHILIISCKRIHGAKIFLERNRNMAVYVSCDKTDNLSDSGRRGDKGYVNEFLRWFVFASHVHIFTPENTIPYSQKNVYRKIKKRDINSRLQAWRQRLHSLYC